MHILIIGDSLTDGYPNPSTSWIPTLKSHFPDDKITALGICGDNLEDVIRRIRLALRSLPPVDHLIIMGGTNDILTADEDDKTDLVDSVLMPSLHTAIQTYSEHIPQITIGIPPTITIECLHSGWQHPDEWELSRDILTQYANQIRQEIPHYIDFQTALNENSHFIDGVHPSPTGYTIMATLTANYLKPQ